MRRLRLDRHAGSDVTRVPAGAALAVDRDAFSAAITREIERTRSCTVLRQTITDVPTIGPGEPVIIATGR